MTPAASVAACISAIPSRAISASGRIGKDQVEDYARRLGESVTEAQRWLAQPFLRPD